MTYGWSTEKQEDGSFIGRVLKIEYQKPTEILHQHVFATRERATAWVKKSCLYYRRGGK